MSPISGSAAATNENRAPDLPASRTSRRDVLRDVPGIAPHAADVLGREGVQEAQPDEVKAGFRSDAAVMDRRVIAVEDRNIDPVVVMPEAGAPDHVCDVE